MIKYDTRLRNIFDGIVIDNEVKCAGHKNNSKNNFKELKSKNFSSTIEVDNVNKEMIIKTNHLLPSWKNHKTTTKSYL